MPHKRAFPFRKHSEAVNELLTLKDVVIIFQSNISWGMENFAVFPTISFSPLIGPFFVLTWTSRDCSLIKYWWNRAVCWPFIPKSVQFKWFVSSQNVQSIYVSSWWMWTPYQHDNRRLSISYLVSLHLEIQESWGPAFSLFLDSLQKLSLGYQVSNWKLWELKYV